MRDVICKPHSHFVGFFPFLDSIVCSINLFSFDVVCEFIYSFVVVVALMSYNCLNQGHKAFKEFLKMLFYSTASTARFFSCFKS